MALSCRRDTNSAPKKWALSLPIFPLDKSTSSTFLSRIKSPKCSFEARPPAMFRTKGEEKSSPNLL